MSDSNKMRLYTTGEIAKLCDVSVRTVQYYDDRGILIPSELSEGGRRLYSEEDLHRMRVICFLRGLGLSIGSIATLFSEEHPERVVSLLLDQQESALLAEKRECEEKLMLIDGMRRELRDVENFSVDSIADIAKVMKNKKDLRRLRLFTVLTGIPVEVLEWVAIILWITQGLWWLSLVWLGTAALWGTWISWYYFRRVAYICPACHEVFRPRFREVFFAYHTPKMRRLNCPACAHHGMCVEIYQKEEK